MKVKIFLDSFYLNKYFIYLKIREVMFFTTCFYLFYIVGCGFE